MRDEMLDMRVRWPRRAIRVEADVRAAKTPPPQPRGSRIAQSSLVAPLVRAEGVMLVDVNAGRRVMLDAFGSRVWELLADQPTLPVLIERLRHEGMRAEQLADDVVRLLVRWRDMGVIAWR